MSNESTVPTVWKDDHIKYMRSLHGGKPIEDIPPESLMGFRLIEDDGESYWDWGEKIIPKSSYKMVYVASRLMEFANCAEYETGKSEFVVPDQFVKDLQDDIIHYVTFKQNEKEGKYIGKFRLTKM
jgi:hypothetical protein